MSVLPRKQFITHVLIYAVGFGMLAKFIPTVVFFPLAFAAAITHLIIVNRYKRARYRAIVDSARTAQIESLPTPHIVHNRDIDDLLLESLKDVTAELEKKCYQLVEKNIQLLSLKEISLTIISSLNEPRIVDSVHSFLSKGLGFKEIFIGIFDPEKWSVHFYTFREALFSDSTMKSYLIVPMLKSTFSQHCWKAADCLLKSEAAPHGAETMSLTPSPDGDSLDAAICPACGRLPVLGVIGVTDGFKAAVLSRVDLVAVETLALQISTLLENAQLYTELKNEESFRDNVINSMMNGIVTADVHGSILLVNEAAERLTGCSADELKGTHIDDLIVDHQKRDDGGPVTRTLRRGEKTLRREVFLVKKDGAQLPIMLNTSLLYDEDRRIQGTIAVFVDITRIKSMEQQIAHLDKLAALGRFSSSMAHEIRNPLAGIVAGLQYLRRVGGISDDQSENLGFILNEVNRIDRLITDILNVIQVKDLVYQPVDPDKLVKNSISIVRDAAEQKSVDIVTEFPEHVQTIMIDYDRITQVLINLLKNAVEASSAGDTVTVRVSYPTDVSDVLFDEIQNFVIIEIEDRGVGFTEDEKGKIFEPFFTTKSEGTGLGLYVSHSIIERHGGYVAVESSKGQGALFSVYLPVEKVQYGDSSEVGHTAGR
ncbi:MAG: ATP-binding protein [bacterium]